MGPDSEHASREKKLPKAIFLIFVHKNVYKIRFQEIKFFLTASLTTSYIFLTKDNYINGSILKAFQLNGTLKGQN